MAATLTEVARRAGVSIATASRAFGEPDRLAPATLHKVLRSADELGYEAPSSTSPRTIGVIVPDLANAFYASLIKAIHAQAWHGRHRIVLLETDEDLRREREQIERAGKLDGYLLCSPRLPVDELERLTEGHSVVVINRTVAGHPSVMTDTENGVRQAVRHLIALGHRHIAYAAGPRTSWADGRRRLAAAETCAEHDVRLTELDHNAATIQGGRAAAATVLSSEATAVIAYNDLVAIGVLAGISDLGRRCPDDISIVGVDDTDLAAASQPGLTTVHIPVDRCGALSVDLLLDVLAGTDAPEIAHIEAQLIVRGSTAPPRR